MEAPDVISSLIALTSLGIVVYKEFFEGPSLNTSVDQVVTVHIGEAENRALLSRMLIDDLLSPTPSPSASQILSRFTAVRSAKLAGDRTQLEASLAAISAGQQLIYNPTLEWAQSYFQKEGLPVGLYLPIIVANTGKKVGHISSIVLILEDSANKRVQFAYAAMATVDPSAFIRHKKLPEAERLAGVFPGASIAPGTSETLHLFMVPMLDAEGKRISDSHLRPGKYRATIFGYGHGRKCLLRSPSAQCEWTAKQLFDAFNGSDAANYLSTEANISSALAEARLSRENLPLR